MIYLFQQVSVSLTGAFWRGRVHFNFRGAVQLCFKHIPGLSLVRQHLLELSVRTHIRFYKFVFLTHAYKLSLKEVFINTSNSKGAIKPFDSISLYHEAA